jgi:iron(II)-dependent oxidoreductase
VLAAIEDIEIRRTLLKRMAEARMQTDKLFDLVRPDSLYERPIPERHRIIFYLGHLEAFDWNLLHPRLPNASAFDPEFDRLFAFGIDPVDGGLPSDQPSDWPARAQIEKYRSRVRATLDAALNSGDEPSPLLLNVAIEHRLMHAETLAYMLHQLPLDQKRREAQAAVPQTPPVRAAMVEIPAGPATLGISRDEPNFGWDNEYEATTADVPDFTIDRYKVTNGEYLKFIDAGGYQERSLWTAAAWEWKSREGIAHPLFWSRTASGWNYRAMFEEIPLPLDWPVYVSHAEASAYAAWAGKRLPTEAEWHRAAVSSRSRQVGDLPHSSVAQASGLRAPWGTEPPAPHDGYFDLERWDPSPVNAFPAGASAFGVEGLLANGWEWTSSVFDPFPGFQPFPFYEGYSANFFDGMHYVMKGGSPRTERCMLRSSFRNWFQPHYQYVYAGFRCAGK